MSRISKHGSAEDSSNLQGAASARGKRAGKAEKAAKPRPRRTPGNSNRRHRELTEKAVGATDLSVGGVRGSVAG